MVSLGRIIIAAIIFLVAVFIFWFGGAVVLMWGNYPEHIPFLGGKTPQALLMEKMSEFGIPRELHFLPTLIGILLIMAVIHAAIRSETIAEDPLRAIFANSMLALLVFVVIGVNWIAVAEVVTGQVGYYSCVITNFVNISAWMEGVSPWEICRLKKEEILLQKFGKYSFLSGKLGVEELNFKVPNIIPGKNYTLWFTLRNLKDEEFQINNVVVNGWVYNHTSSSLQRLNITDADTYLSISLCEVECIPPLLKPKTEIIDYYPSETEGWYTDYNSTTFVGEKVVETEVYINATCDWKENKILRENWDHRCSAKVFIPEKKKSYKPIIHAIWTQTVEGYEKFRVVSTIGLYEKSYKPICAEKAGISYYCPTTTEGPIDLGIGFIPRQYIVGSTPYFDMIVKVSNEHVKGRGNFISIALPSEINGIDISECQTKINRWLKEEMKGDVIEYGKTYTSEPCDISKNMPSSLDVPYKEIPVRISGTYIYTQVFELPEIHA